MKKPVAVSLLLVCMLSLIVAGTPLLSRAEEVGQPEEVAAPQAVSDAVGDEGAVGLYAPSEEPPQDDAVVLGTDGLDPEADIKADAQADGVALDAQDTVHGDTVAVGSVGTYDDVATGFRYKYEVLSVQTNLDGSVTGTAKLYDMEAMPGAFDDVDNPYGTVDVTLPSEVNGLTVVELGESETDYGEFEGHPYLRSIVIPNTITKLNGTVENGSMQSGGLWQYGYNLEEISFEEGSKITEIPPGYFSRTKIRSMVLPDTVKTIGEYAFMNCANLTEVNMPADLETIGDSAFCSTSLTHVDFPSKLRTIGDYAFSKKVFYTQQCGWEPEEYTLTVELDSVILPNTVTSIGAYAFATEGGAYAQGDSYAFLSDIGEISFGTGLTTIGEGAFSGCSVDELVLPNALTTLGKDAFATSPWLESVRFADVDSAQLTTLTGFSTCVALREIEVPPTVTEVAESALRDCKALASIALPPSVETIGEYAFNGCESLATVLLPPSVTDIADWAFSYCSALTDTGLVEGVETIGRGAYLGCSSLGELTIPATVSDIGPQAFAGTGITALTIAQGDTPLSIGPRAFRGCKGLAGTTVELPKRVAALGAEAFLYSDNVTFKIYNDALAIGVADEDVYGWYNYIEGDLTEAELGSLFSSELGLAGGEDEAGNPYYSWSMDDPWGGSSRDARQDILDEVADPAASKVYYPNTLTNETSPTFDVYVKCIAWQYASYGTGGTGYGPWKYVWPTFEAFDVESGQVDPGPDPDDPATIEEAAKGKLQVYTTGNAGSEANVCVFDASGALVASGQASTGYTLIDDVEPGTYTVVAFAKNSSFSTVGSLSDFADMGLSTSNYAKKSGVSIAKDKATEVTLAVPAMGSQTVTKLLESSSVVISKKSVPLGVENTATINYQMASGKKASTLVVKVPKGLTVAWASSATKNYGTSGFNASTRKLTLNLASADASSGKIWVGLKGEAAGSYSVNASISSSGTTVPAGSIAFRCYGLQLDLPTQPVSGSSFEATVHAKPGSTVTVATAEKTFSFGPTNKAGTYTGTIDLGDYSTLGVSQLSVFAEVADGGETFAASGTVTFEAASLINAPTLKEFSFVHGPNRTLLVKDGRRYANHYTYLAFGNDRPSYKNWTFSATYTSTEKMTGSATVQVQMLDGSSRYQQMSLKSQTKKDGVWTADFTTSMYIEQAGNHVFDDASLIPVAFDVLYSYDLDPEELDDTGEFSQDEIVRFRQVAYQPLVVWKAEVRKVVEEANEGEEYDEDRDYTWPMFHRYTDDPELQVIIEMLPEEVQQQLAEIDEDLVVCTDAIEQMQGFKTTARGCADVTDYLTKNLSIALGKAFDITKLLGQGYQVFADEGAASSGIDSGTPTSDGGYAIPGNYAVRHNEDAKGNVTSISIADSNGTFATIPVPDATKKFKPLKPLHVDPNMGSTDLLGFSSGVSSQCAATGVALIGLDSTVASKGLSWGLTSGQIAKLSTHLGNCNTVFTILGFISGETAASLGFKQAEIDYENFNNAEDNAQSLKLKEHYMSQHLEQYSLACYMAVQEQRKLYEEIARLFQDKYNYDYGDATNSKWLTRLGVCGKKGAILSFGIGNAIKFMTFPSHRIAEGKLANRLKRLEDLEKYIAQVCKGMNPHNATYDVDAILDPAGSVYEAVPTNLLEGVTATVVDATTGEAWDAASYDQVNPQVTGEDGSFQWDVPSGSWKVRFEKEGYETGETDALQVPPPQLGISYGMVSTAAPTVTSVAAGTDFAEITFSQYMDCAKGATVYVGDSIVDPGTFEWLDPEEGADGTQLSRVLLVPVPKGTKVGSTVTVGVSGAVNYAGTSMATAVVRTPKAQVMPARIEFNFEGTISLQVGVLRPTAVRVYDRAGNPIEGATITASLDNDYLATVDATGAVTDADGTARVQLEALLPGISTLTVGVEGTSLTREIRLLTTVDANVCARPTGKLGNIVIDKGAPAESAYTVTAGTKLELATTTEDAVIYYTTDGSCPCQNTPNRQTYTGPISVAESGTYVIASYKEGMDYSEKLRLHITVTGAVDFSKVSVAKIDSQIWYGGAVEPELSVTYAGGIVAPTGYDVAFSNNDHPGTATATLTGKGAYQGEKKATFKVILPFTDVTWNQNPAKGTPHLEDVLWMAENGISAGWGTIPNATFKPYANVARADLAAFLFRLAKLWGVLDASDDWQPTAATKARFTDVNDKTSHCREIWWMAEKGISTGWAKGKGFEFRPYANVARADLAAFLGRIAKQANIAQDVQPDLGAFRDVTAKTAHREEVGWMAASGISAGWTMKDGSREFRPLANVARCDLAAFLHRMDALR